MYDMSGNGWETEESGGNKRKYCFCVFQILTLDLTPRQ